jgi:hypothetical protein
MCYLSCRCTRSLSIVPPLAYARLAAERARCLMEEVPQQGTEPGIKVSLGLICMPDEATSIRLDNCNGIFFVFFYTWSTTGGTTCHTLSLLASVSQ